jgi:hypothetical protein
MYACCFAIVKQDADLPLTETFTKVQREALFSKCVHYHPTNHLMSPNYIRDVDIEGATNNNNNNNKLTDISISDHNNSNQRQDMQRRSANDAATDYNSGTDDVANTTVNSPPRQRSSISDTTSTSNVADV